MSDTYVSIFEMIDRRLGNIEETQHGIKTDIAVIKERQVDIIKDLSSMKSTIYGNGKPGLVTEVALNRQKTGIISVCFGFVASIIGTVIINAFKGK